LDDNTSLRLWQVGCARATRFRQIYGYNSTMEWIYLSPHPDDIALSCGGLVRRQAQQGDAVSIWTICTGDPPGGAISPFAGQLHARWGVDRRAMAARRKEDRLSCASLGAAHKHFSVPDCIYRRSPVSGKHLYDSETTIFSAVHLDETQLLADLSALIEKHLPPQAQLVCPLALGGHVDHRLTRAAAEVLGNSLWYYADYPYVLRNAEDIPRLLPPGWERQVFELSEADLQAWVRSVAAHQSQISTFWDDLGALRSMLQAYIDQNGGASLWQPPAEPTEDQPQPES